MVGVELAAVTLVGESYPVANAGDALAWVASSVTWLR